LVETRREVERQRDFVRSTFGRYMDDRLVDRVLAQGQAQDLIGERARVTILMSDLRGFTYLAEGVKPEDALNMLNTYLGVMLQIISDHQGTIDNIIGDGILAVFGTPQPGSEDAAHAVSCAIAMQAAMPEINQTLTELGLPTLTMGIGINTGEVIVGNVGSEAHMKYSVIGSPVNLAARIESLTFGGQILVSATTYEEVKHQVHASGHLRVKVKGIDDPVHIYDVSGQPTA
jgi:adenylate cyclase